MLSVAPLVSVRLAPGLLVPEVPSIKHQGDFDYQGNHGGGGTVGGGHAICNGRKRWCAFDINRAGLLL